MKYLTIIIQINDEAANRAVNPFLIPIPGGVVIGAGQGDSMSAYEEVRGILPEGVEKAIEGKFGV